MLCSYHVNLPLDDHFAQTNQIDLMCQLYLRLSGAAERLRAVVFEFRRLVLVFPLTRSILIFSRIQIHPSQGQNHTFKIVIFRHNQFRTQNDHIPLFEQQKWSFQLEIVVCFGNMVSPNFHMKNEFGQKLGYFARNFDIFLLNLFRQFFFFLPNIILVRCCLFQSSYSLFKRFRMAFFSSFFSKCVLSENVVF